MALVPPAYGIDFVDRAAGAPVQRVQQHTDNRTGMPDRLKTGIEALSGIDVSDVRVHVNSAKPAQLSAFAYAQGSEIHLSAGAEKHLPHEAWHVVQQRQGRVRPTLQAEGAAINDDPHLEHEADLMGRRAAAYDGGAGVSLPAQLKCTTCAQEEPPYQRVATGPAAGVMQLASCYFFKNADCQGARVYATSKHNFRDYDSYNCSGEAGGADCVANDGKGHCYCPEPKEEAAPEKPAKTGPVSAYDDPTTSRESKALIARGVLTGTYPPKH